ncbi:DUF6090 family protein [Algoriphagus namhaensis]|uniref:DUF6090 family protein n=1 Tax=Algoriphagus namhaensis TaxID=915353 RepID=A0ABV8APV1_9BACT
MISLFRKIRQKLLAQNRVTRYLVYALGEILLVVIGILIALQVNNWNEENKTQQKEKLYLSRLKEDAKWNIDVLDSQIKFYQRNTMNLDSIGSFLSSGAPKNDNLKIPANPSFISAWKLKNSTYTELVSSGTLGTLSDVKLREMLDEIASFETITIRTLNYWRDLSVADADLFRPYRIQETSIVNGDTVKTVSLNYEQMLGKREVIAGIQFWSFANQKFAAGIEEYKAYYIRLLERIECLENNACSN